jgi:hypothetical protein
MKPNTFVGKVGYEILDNGIKFFSTVDENFELAFILRMSTTDAPVHYFFNKFYKKGDWCIPHFDFTGCSYISAHYVDTMIEVFRVIIPNHFSEKKLSENVICVGLNKTGTTSLKKDMIGLGYKMFPEEVLHQYVFPDVYHKNLYTTLGSLENPKYNFYQDLPFSLPNFYGKIFREDRNDTYLLTIRPSVEEFVDSFVSYYSKYFQYGNVKNFDQKTRYHFNYFYVDDITTYNLHYAFFQLWELNELNNVEKKVGEMYNRHVDGCVDFFEKKNYKNFQIVDVSKKGELKKLSSWLGLPNQKDDFCWENKKEN